MRRVLDTNAVLYLLGGRLAERLPPGEFLASVITEMELLSYPSIDAKAETQIRSFLSEVVVIGLSQPVIDLAIRLRRERGLKLPDAVIAASALSLNAELWTNDDKLSSVPGLKCRKPRLKG